MARGSDFVTHVRVEATIILDASNRLNGLRKEWDRLDYGNTLALTDAFSPDGDNANLNPAVILAVMGSTLDAINVLLNAGHGTNLEKIRV